MENMTALQATALKREYDDYKVECIRANGEYYDFDTWLVLRKGYGGANKPEVYGKPAFQQIAERLDQEEASAQRKATPIFSGVLKYFPDALAAVARLSKAGNDKHNPGEPLHWSRGKSNDHGDCLVRHQLEFDAIDPETGEYHAVAVAWRALAQLQLLEEARAASHNRRD